MKIRGKNAVFGRTQYVLLIGTVESAFALLLTKVTKQNKKWGDFNL